MLRKSIKKIVYMEGIQHDGLIIHSEMITTVKLINIFISSHSYPFVVCVVRAPEIYFLFCSTKFNSK